LKGWASLQSHIITCLYAENCRPEGRKCPEVQEEYRYI
jgi:hypothetical protein